MTLLALGVVVFVAILLYRRFADVPQAPDDRLDAQRRDVLRALVSMKKKT